ncbi:MAG: hypothetical protein ACUVQ8_02620 [Nitrososphaeria archaeon]
MDILKCGLSVAELILAVSSVVSGIELMVYVSEGVRLWSKEVENSQASKEGFSNERTEWREDSALETRCVKLESPRDNSSDTHDRYDS